MNIWCPYGDCVFYQTVSTQVEECPGCEAEFWFEEVYNWDMSESWVEVYWDNQ